jgi:CRISPR-associated protein Cmr6
MPDKNDVPLMYRSQLEGRCQLQRIHKKIELEDIAQEEGLNKNKAAQYSQRWVNQWLESGVTVAPDRRVADTDIFKSKEYQISWRFVTNGGKDDGIIRPLIAGSGLPFYPGSSMKGSFRAACQREEQAGRIPPGTTNLYCGDRHVNQDSEGRPGILRFHGGYPVNQGWEKNLLDIVHPQQQWQVRIMDTSKKPSNESAFALISLHKPILRFEISCSSAKIDWDEIWGIWEKALGYGIGCRVSCGYGLADGVSGDILYRVNLHGTGLASKLLNQNSEFRPNIFRAALRGHALRIFSGLNPAQAEGIVDKLFGGIRPKQEQVGLLGMAFHQDSLHLDVTYGSDVYDVSGELNWLLLGTLDRSEDRICLSKLIENLTQFAMLLGGFGKSWRRADHTIFYPEYKKHIIGCHWEWGEGNTQINSCNDATILIHTTIASAQEWMVQQGIELKPAIAQLVNSDRTQAKKPVPRPVPVHRGMEWREAWERENVQVWGRICQGKQDSKVIPWLHNFGSRDNKEQSYSKQDRSKNQSNQSIPLALQKAPKPTNAISSRPSIYRTSLTGRLKDKNKSEDPTQIGRLWHRMYPLENNRYLELITIFPKNCTEGEQLIRWLASEEAKKDTWEKIW